MTTKGMSLQDRINAAKRAFVAAKKSIDENLQPGQVAREEKVSRESVTLAKLLILYGSDEEKRVVEMGEVGLKTAAREVRRRFTPEQRAEQRSRQGGRPFTDEGKAKTKLDRDLWVHLKPAILNLASMPDVSGVVSVVKASRGRETTVNQNIQAARAWLEDFANAWEQYQQSKGTNANSGGGNHSAGVQYPKQAAE